MSTGCRKTKNFKPHNRSECRCLTCDFPSKSFEIYDGLKILVCGSEACFLNCNTCTDRPVYCYGQQRKKEVV